MTLVLKYAKNKNMFFKKILNPKSKSFWFFIFLILVFSVFYFFWLLSNIEFSTKQNRFGPHSNWNSKEMVRSYSFEEFCEKIEASQYFIKDQNLESNYIYSNLNLFGICEGRGNAEAGFTHTNYIFDNFEIDSFVKNEDPLSWDTSFDYHISFLNGQIDKKYAVPHPEELAENEDYYFQSKSQRNQTFFTIISKNTAEIATVQRPQLSYNFPVNSKCKNSFDEMNQKISDSNTNYIETKEKAEEL